MGRLADLRAKCSNGVSETCSEAEFAEFQRLMQENSGTSWFDRILGGFGNVSNTVFGIYDRATGQYRPPGGYYPQQPPPQPKTSPLVWIGVVVGAIVLIVMLVLILRKKPK